jgi:hypothetical protein
MILAIKKLNYWKTLFFCIEDWPFLNIGNFLIDNNMVYPFLLCKRERVFGWLRDIHHVQHKRFRGFLSFPVRSWPLICVYGRILIAKTKYLNVHLAFMLRSCKWSGTVNSFNDE